MDIVQFNGVSNLDVGLICLDAGRRQRAQERIIVHDIPYRNDQVLIHTGKYLPYNRPMIFAWKDKTKTAAALSWLNGAGKLQVTQDEGGYFKSNITSGHDVERKSPKYDAFSVNFFINPGFFYLDSGDEMTILTVPSTVVNPGTIYSQPLIKVVGSGDINVEIKGVIFQLKGVVDHIVIDSETEQVYRDTLLEGEKMTGEFPVIAPGSNTIAWTGTVTRVELTGRWREE